MTTFVAILACITPLLVVFAQWGSRRDRDKKAAALATKVEQTAVDLAVKVDETATHLAIKTEEIHVLVNSRLTEALERIAELEAHLGIGEGDPVPPKNGGE